MHLEIFNFKFFLLLENVLNEEFKKKTHRNKSMR
ncbi:hypothetical protein HNQ03_002550 [Chryseobacterium sp. 16F]|uniref:Uncharacterized protein n=1 Tax=Frigoriflavimonas asaccharolytica TaxID=2735899 RepID=A0A8J8GCJ4_9FLAO|nr:hypothetical protein [Frigoriflavimonas asaccharolytica]